MLKLKFLSNFSDFGFFLLRLVVGGSFVVHGYPKIIGGPDMWTNIGNMAGIHQAPVVFGFLAAFAEAFGGLFLVLGFMTRFMSILLLGTMIGALNFHITKGDDFNMYSHALELGGVFLGLIFMGPGAYSMDKG